MAYPSEQRRVSSVSHQRQVTRKLVAYQWEFRNYVVCDIMTVQHRPKEEIEGSISYDGISHTTGGDNDTEISSQCNRVKCATYAQIGSLMQQHYIRRARKYDLMQLNSPISEALGPPHRLKKYNNGWDCSWLPSSVCIRIGKSLSCRI